MSADSLLQFLTQALFVAIFVVVAVQAVRRPTRVNFDIALLFGALSGVVGLGWIADVLDLPDSHWRSALTIILLLAQPYLLLRLLQDFTRVPRWVGLAAGAGLALAALAVVLVPPPLPLPLLLSVVVYFVTIEVYATIVFVRSASQSSGVTRRRMLAAALGTVLLGLVILIAGARAVFPAGDSVWTVLSRASGLASGLAYFLAFATPPFLRRAWQEPELRAFLGRAASLPRLPDTPSIVRELERGAAEAVGAPAATIALWDAEEEVLVAVSAPEAMAERIGRPGEYIGGQAFQAQRAIFTANAARDDPAHADVYHAYGANAVVAAPITAGDKRLGVLTVYAERAPLFAEEDLELLKLLADQAAVILESRALIDNVARVQAREEATRLKDDFLSAAAHDLKTPLTTLLAQAQMLERRILAAPDQPVEVQKVQVLVREAQRLKALVLELLDAARVERRLLTADRERVDLVELAREICATWSTERHPCSVAAEGPLVGEWDPVRLSQLFQNLVENGIKYSPDGGSIEIHLAEHSGRAVVQVTDYGIGIPAADLPHIFERFHRASNVDDRRYSGMGLGLYICRGIVEEHGGQIEASSRRGEGTTFQITLPLRSGSTSVTPALATA